MKCSLIFLVMPILAIFINPVSISLFPKWTINSIVVLR
uniref:Uncharacterized protein n=1 Tax=Arundo donax TaxID=35708 RepID=A0A0A9HH07_ARUDO